MRRGVAAIMIVVMLGVTSVVPASAAPYVSCRDGHIVKTLSECPPVRNPISVHPGSGSGGGGGGLLGTIGRIVGGLTGGLL